MAETIDRRVTRTQKALHRALMSLIQRIGYEAITIQDLIDEADIGRSTFYSHYTGKADLLRSGFWTLRAELKAARELANEKSDRPQNEPLRFSLAMFEHASQYAETYRALVGGRGGTIAISEIRQILSDLVRKDLSSIQNNDVVPRDARVQFIVGTFLTMLTWWLERKPTLTPFQVDAMFRRLVLHGIAGQTTT